MPLIVYPLDLGDCETPPYKLCVCQGGAPTKLGFVSRAIQNVMPLSNVHPSIMTYCGPPSPSRTHLRWANWWGTGKTLKFVGFRTFVPPWCSQWRSQFVLHVVFRKFVLDDASPNDVSIVLRNFNVSLSCVWPSVPECSHPTYVPSVPTSHMFTSHMFCKVFPILFPNKPQILSLPKVFLNLSKWHRMWYNSKNHKFIYQKSSNVANKIQILQKQLLNLRPQNLNKFSK
jgi:hypothetical protein